MISIIAGIAKVCRESYPDFTSWDKKSKYYDAKSTEANPRWFMVDVEPIEDMGGFSIHSEL